METDTMFDQTGGGAYLSLDELGSILTHLATLGKMLTLSSPGSLSVYKFSLYYPHKISCLVMRIKQMIIHSNLSKMKDKILLTCLQGNKRRFRRIQ